MRCCPGFNAANNGLALHFALDAIGAQPVSYARTVASGVMLTFLTTDRTLNVRQLHFTPAPDVARLDRSQRRHLAAYGHVGSNTHPVEPYAYFLYLYQQAPGSPLDHLPGRKFSAGKNSLAMAFALRAITAQPLGYAAAVLHDVSLAFDWNIPAHPSSLMIRRYEFGYATR